MIVSRCARGWCNFVPAIDEGANGNIYEVESWNERKAERNNKKSACCVCKLCNVENTFRTAE